MGPPPRGLSPTGIRVEGFKSGVSADKIGKSWHQSAQCVLQGPACGMCHGAYALSDHIAWLQSQRCR